MSNPRPPAMPFCTTTARPVTKFRPRISPNPQNQTAAPATPASPQHTPALHPCQSLAIRSEKTTALFEHGHGTNSIPGPRGHSPVQGTQPGPGDTARSRGHSPVQGTQPCSGDTSPAHIAPKDRTHCTNTTHNGCTDSRHSPPRGMAPRDGPEGWPRRDDLSGCGPRGHSHTQGTQALPRGHTACPQRPPQPAQTAKTAQSACPGSMSGDTALPAQPRSRPGDTPPVHNSPRTESTAQTLNTMVAPTAVTDRRRRMARTR